MSIIRAQLTKATPNCQKRRSLTSLTSSNILSLGSYQVLKLIKTKDNAISCCIARVPLGSKEFYA